MWRIQKSLVGLLRKRHKATDTQWGGVEFVFHYHSPTIFPQIPFASLVIFARNVS